MRGGPAIGRHLFESGIIGVESHQQFTTDESSLALSAVSIEPMAGGISLLSIQL